MLEGIIGGVLGDVLGDFVEEFRQDKGKSDKKALKIGLWDGQVTMHSVALRRDCLQTSLGLRMAVEGMLGDLSITLPWRSLQSKPVEVEVDGLYAVVTPLDDSEIVVAGAGAGRQSVDERKQRLAVNESAMLKAVKKSIENKAMEESGKGGKNSKAAADALLKSSMLMQILKLVRVSVKNIHVRYQVPLDIPGRCSSFGLCVEKLSVENETDVEFVPETQEEIPVEKKVITLKGLNIYCDRDDDLCPERPPTETEQSLLEFRERFQKFMAASLKSKSHTFILPPLKFTVNVVWPAAAATTKDRKTRVTSDVPRISVCFTREQYEIFLRVVNSIRSITDDDNDEMAPAIEEAPRVEETPAKRIRFSINDARPGGGGQGNAKAWWRYAISKAVLKNREDKKTDGMYVGLPLCGRYITERRKTRLLYCKLFKEKVITKKIGRRDTKTLETMDMVLPMEDIMYFRSITVLSFQRSLKGLDEKKSRRTSRPPERRSSVAPSTPSLSSSDVRSSGISERSFSPTGSTGSFDDFDYEASFGKMSKEDMEALEKFNANAVAETDAMVDFNISLSDFSFRLLKMNERTNDISPVLSFQLSSTQIAGGLHSDKTKDKKKNKGMSLNFLLRTEEVSLVDMIHGEIILSSMTRYTSDGEALPFLNVDLGINSVDKHRINVDVSPLTFTAYPGIISTVIDFIVPPEDVSVIQMLHHLSFWIDRTFKNRDQKSVLSSSIITANSAIAVNTEASKGIKTLLKNANLKLILGEINAMLPTGSYLESEKKDKENDLMSLVIKGVTLLSKDSEIPGVEVVLEDISFRDFMIKYTILKPFTVDLSCFFNEVGGPSLEVSMTSMDVCLASTAIDRLVSALFPFLKTMAPYISTIIELIPALKKGKKEKVGKGMLPEFEASLDLRGFGFSWEQLVGEEQYASLLSVNVSGLDGTAENRDAKLSAQANIHSVELNGTTADQTNTFCLFNIDSGVEIAASKSSSTPLDAEVTVTPLTVNIPLDYLSGLIQSFATLSSLSKVVEAVRTFKPERTAEVKEKKKLSLPLILLKLDLLPGTIGIASGNKKINVEYMQMSINATTKPTNLFAEILMSSLNISIDFPEDPYIEGSQIVSSKFLALLSSPEKQALTITASFDFAEDILFTGNVDVGSVYAYLGPLFQLLTIVFEGLMPLKFNDMFMKSGSKKPKKKIGDILTAELVERLIFSFDVAVCDIHAFLSGPQDISFGEARVGGCMVHIHSHNRSYIDITGIQLISTTGALVLPNLDFNLQPKIMFPSQTESGLLEVFIENQTQDEVLAMSIPPHFVKDLLSFVTYMMRYVYVFKIARKKLVPLLLKAPPKVKEEMFTIYANIKLPWILASICDEELTTEILRFGINGVCVNAEIHASLISLKASIANLGILDDSDLSVLAGRETPAIVAGVGIEKMLDMTRLSVSADVYSMHCKNISSKSIAGLLKFVAGLKNIPKKQKKPKFGHVKPLPERLDISVSVKNELVFNLFENEPFELHAHVRPLKAMLQGCNPLLENLVATVDFAGMSVVGFENGVFSCKREISIFELGKFDVFCSIIMHNFSGGLNGMSINIPPAIIDQVCAVLGELAKCKELNEKELQLAEKTFEIDDLAFPAEFYPKFKPPAMFGSFRVCPIKMYIGGNVQGIKLTTLETLVKAESIVPTTNDGENIHYNFDETEKVSISIDTGLKKCLIVSNGREDSHDLGLSCNLSVNCHMLRKPKVQITAGVNLGSMHITLCATRVFLLMAIAGEFLAHAKDLPALPSQTIAVKKKKRKPLALPEAELCVSAEQIVIDLLQSAKLGIESVVIKAISAPEQDPKVELDVCDIWVEDTHLISSTQNFQVLRFKKSPTQQPVEVRASLSLDPLAITVSVRVAPLTCVLFPLLLQKYLLDAGGAMGVVKQGMLLIPVRKKKAPRKPKPYKPWPSVSATVEIEKVGIEVIAAQNSDYLFADGSVGVSITATVEKDSCTAAVNVHTPSFNCGFEKSEQQYVILPAVRLICEKDLSVVANIMNAEAGIGGSVKVSLPAFDVIVHHDELKFFLGSMMKFMKPQFFQQGDVQVRHKDSEHHSWTIIRPLKAFEDPKPRKTPSDILKALRAIPLDIDVEVDRVALTCICNTREFFGIGVTSFAVSLHRENAISIKFTVDGNVVGDEFTSQLLCPSEFNITVSQADVPSVLVSSTEKMIMQLEAGSIRIIGNFLKLSNGETNVDEKVVNEVKSRVDESIPEPISPLVMYSVDNQTDLRIKLYVSRPNDVNAPIKIQCDEGSSGMFLLTRNDVAVPISLPNDRHLFVIVCRNSSPDPKKVCVLIRPMLTFYNSTDVEIQVSNMKEDDELDMLTLPPGTERAISVKKLHLWANFAIRTKDAQWCTPMEWSSEQNAFDVAFDRSGKTNVIARVLPVGNNLYFPNGSVCPLQRTAVVLSSFVYVESLLPCECQLTLGTDESRSTDVVDLLPGGRKHVYSFSMNRKVEMSLIVLLKDDNVESIREHFTLDLNSRSASKVLPLKLVGNKMPTSLFAEITRDEYRCWRIKLYCSHWVCNKSSFPLETNGFGSISSDPEKFSLVMCPSKRNTLALRIKGTSKFSSDISLSEGANGKIMVDLPADPEGDERELKTSLQYNVRRVSGNLLPSLCLTVYSGWSCENSTKWTMTFAQKLPGSEEIVKTYVVPPGGMCPLVCEPVEQWDGSTFAFKFDHTEWSYGIPVGYREDTDIMLRKTDGGFVIVPFSCETVGTRSKIVIHDDCGYAPYIIQNLSTVMVTAVQLGSSNPPIKVCPGMQIQFALESVTLNKELLALGHVISLTDEFSRDIIPVDNETRLEYCVEHGENGTIIAFRNYHEGMFVIDTPAEAIPMVNAAVALPGFSFSLTYSGVSFFTVNVENIGVNYELTSWEHSVNVAIGVVKMFNSLERARHVVLFGNISHEDFERGNYSQQTETGVAPDFLTVSLKKIVCLEKKESHIFSEIRVGLAPMIISVDQEIIEAIVALVFVAFPNLISNLLSPEQKEKELSKAVKDDISEMEKVQKRASLLGKPKKKEKAGFSAFVEKCRIDPICVLLEFSPEPPKQPFSPTRPYLTHRALMGWIVPILGTISQSPLVLKAFSLEGHIISKENKKELVQLVKKHYVSDAVNQVFECCHGSGAYGVSVNKLLRLIVRSIL